MKKKILFFHFDLGNGGAEKALVNLLKCLDYQRYDITLFLLFNYGVNLAFLPPNVKLRYLFNRSPFRGVTQLLKILSPKALHKLLIKDRYDVEIAYMEGSPTRIVGACPYEETRLYSWVHTQDDRGFFNPYRTLGEAKKTYLKFDKILFVSDNAKQTFEEKMGWESLSLGVCHNVIDSDDIKEKSQETIDINISSSQLNICSVGRLTEVKGYARLLRILGQLKDNVKIDWRLYILGQGEQKQLLESILAKFGLQERIHLLGYDANPYKYVSKMDVFVCSSYKEGYSTAVTESIVVGTPVITTDCSGMREIIGDSKAGIIVENSDEGLKGVLEDLLNGKINIKELKVNALKRSNYFGQSNIKEFEDVINEV